MRHGNEAHASSEVNGQTAKEVGTTQGPIKLGSLSIKQRLQLRNFFLCEVVSRVNERLISLSQKES